MMTNGPLAKPVKGKALTWPPICPLMKYLLPRGVALSSEYSGSAGGASVRFSSHRARMLLDQRLVNTCPDGVTVEASNLAGDGPIGSALGTWTSVRAARRGRAPTMAAATTNLMKVGRMS
jgi:hypothetical protein